LVLRTFPPSSLLMPFVSSHCASHAHRTFAEIDKSKGLKAVMDVAAQCSLQVIRFSQKTVSAAAKVLKLETVLAYTNGPSEEALTVIDAEREEDSECESDDDAGGAFSPRKSLRPPGSNFGRAASSGASSSSSSSASRKLPRMATTQEFSKTDSKGGLSSLAEREESVSRTSQPGDD